MTRVSINYYFEEKESRNGSNQGPFAYQPSALPQGHTGSHLKVLLSYMYTHPPTCLFALPTYPFTVHGENSESLHTAFRIAGQTSVGPVILQHDPHQGQVSVRGEKQAGVLLQWLLRLVVSKPRDCGRGITACMAGERGSLPLQCHATSGLRDEVGWACE